MVDLNCSLLQARQFILTPRPNQTNLRYFLIIFSHCFSQLLKQIWDLKVHNLSFVSLSNLSLPLIFLPRSKILKMRKKNCFIPIIHSNKVTATPMREAEWGRNQEKQSHFHCILQNRFDHAGFRFYSWIGRFLLFTGFKLIFSFLS